MCFCSSWSCKMLEAYCSHVAKLGTVATLGQRICFDSTPIVRLCDVTSRVAFHIILVFVHLEVFDPLRIGDNWERACNSDFAQRLCARAIHKGACVHTFIAGQGSHMAISNRFLAQCALQCLITFGKTWRCTTMFPCPNVEQTMLSNSAWLACRVLSARSPFVLGRRDSHPNPQLHPALKP